MLYFAMIFRLLSCVCSFREFFVKSVVFVWQGDRGPDGAKGFPGAAGDKVV